MKHRQRGLGEEQWGSWRRAEERGRNNVSGEGDNDFQRFSKVQIHTWEVQEKKYEKEKNITGNFAFSAAFSSISQVKQDLS